MVPGRTSITPAYSEHQVYIDTYLIDEIDQDVIDKRLSMIKAYFRGENGSEHPILKEGIHYAVVFKSVKGYNTPPDGETVYDNAEIRIIRIE